MLNGGLRWAGCSYFELEGRIDRSTANFDPQVKYAVDMSYFFDVEVLKIALQGTVSVSTLPGMA